MNPSAYWPVTRDERSPGDAASEIQGPLSRVAHEPDVLEGRREARPWRKAWGDLRADARSGDSDPADHASLRLQARADQSSRALHAGGDARAVSAQPRAARAHRRLHLAAERLPLLNRI